jgi:hypothetical protein
MDQKLYVYEKSCCNTQRKAFKIKIKPKKNYDQNIYYSCTIIPWTPFYKYNKLSSFHNGYYCPIKQFIKFKDERDKEIYKLVTKIPNKKIIMLFYYKQSNDWSVCENFRSIILTNDDLKYFISWSDKFKNIIMNL